MTILSAFLLVAQAAPGAMITNTPTIPTTVSVPTAPQVPGATALPAIGAAPVHMVRGPQERGTTQSYISPDDYPAAARGTRAHGVVGFTLTINTDGRVIGCTITRSSGSPVLDAATCRIIQRRARYTPAMDSNGNPVIGTIAQQIEWRAP